MEYQSTLKFKENNQRFFVTIGNETTMGTSLLHRHRFNEFFFLEEGHLDFEVDGRVYHLTAGNLLVIPAKVVHSCISKGIGKTSYLWMKTEGVVPELAVISCPQQVISELIQTVKNLDNSNEQILKVKVLLIFLCYDVFENGKNKALEIYDYDFLIDEYLGCDITLAALAQKLNVSQRQAERLVLRHTGKTFKQNQLEKRMLAARSMIEKGTLSKEKIAERVGYNSYKGFRKAYNNYFGNLKQDY